MLCNGIAIDPLQGLNGLQWDGSREIKAMDYTVNWVPEASRNFRT